MVKEKIKDTSNQKLISIVSDNLGKYGFKLDSLKGGLTSSRPVLKISGTSDDDLGGGIKFLRKSATGGDV